MRGGEGGSCALVIRNKEPDAHKPTLQEVSEVAKLRKEADW